jgi:hypothetical protein
MRALVFANVSDGDTVPASPHTLDGAAACMRWVCPSLTDEEALAAAREAHRRHLSFTRRHVEALIREMFEQA